MDIHLETMRKWADAFILMGEGAKVQMSSRDGMDASARMNAAADEFERLQRENAEIKAAVEAVRAYRDALLVVDEADIATDAMVEWEADCAMRLDDALSAIAKANGEDRS